jgi:hypothetical protein
MSWLSAAIDKINQTVQGTGAQALGDDKPTTPAPTFTPPESGDSGIPGGLDAMTAQLYSQLLGLMDQQANTDLANEQIGSLSNILNQQANLDVKDQAARDFASGKATPTNIAPILQGKSQALAQGVTQINTAAQARADANQALGMETIINLRNSLVGERQAEFDRALNVAMLDYQQWIDQQNLDLAQEEKDAKFFELLTTAAMLFI